MANVCVVLGSVREGRMGLRVARCLVTSWWRSSLFGKAIMFLTVVAMYTMTPDMITLTIVMMSVCHEKWSLCPTVSIQLLLLLPGRFSWFFMVPGWVVMVPGLFSWFFMVPGWFFMVFHGFSWFQVGFSWFFSKMYPPKLYPGPMIQSRSATRRAA